MKFTKLILNIEFNHFLPIALKQSRYFFYNIKKIYLI